jgi:hypothetical protein
MAVVASRVLYFGYAVVAGFALPVMRELLNGAYSLDTSDGTLYVPLVLCTPGSVVVDGTVVSYDASELENCFTLDFLVNACAASLFLSAFATIVYVLIDAMTRCGKGPFKRSSLAGMSLFLTFLLLQTGLCVGAVVKQAEFWENHNRLILDLSNLEIVEDGQTYQVNDVSTYGNTTFLFAVAIVAFAAAFVAFCDFVAGMCCRSNKKDDHFDDPQKSLSALQKSSELDQSNDLSLTPSSSALNTNGASTVEPENQGQLVDPTATDQSGRPSWITGV